MTFGLRLWQKRQNAPKSISVILYYVKRHSECWQSTLKNEDDLHAVGANTQSRFNSSYKQMHPMSLVCNLLLSLINGKIWCTPKNCFKVNLFTVNVWSVYMFYIPISLASDKAFLDKKGADWERRGSLWLGNVLWGTVVSKNTGRITDLHVGTLGGPLIWRDLKSHPLAFLSMSSIQQKKGSIITVLGRAAAVAQFAEPLTTCTKLGFCSQHNINWAWWHAC